MQTLILQSYRAERVSNWLQRCLDSVADWADRHNYQYLFIGDELFDDVPDWFMQKVDDRRPIGADLGRLLWIQRLLERRAADVVVWLDADVLIFAPQQWRVRLVQDCVFGRERWLQKEDNRAGFKIYNNVHNAYCAFAQGSTTLPFLADRMQHLVRQVDADHMPPQFVGPKLLTALHNIVKFDLEPAVGAVSPMLASALLAADQSELLDRFIKQSPAPMCAANLCASLVAAPADTSAERQLLREDTMGLVVERLLAFRSGLK